MRRKVPVAVAAVVNQVIAGSHASLNALFAQAGVPGEPPALSHAAKWKTWLLSMNGNMSVDDPMAVVGKVVEEFMEVDPIGLEPEFLQLRLDNRKHLLDVLASYNLQYKRGGRIEPIDSGPPGSRMEEMLRAGRLEEVEIEFQRTVDDIDRDPSAAATAACSMLEALFRSYLEQHGLPLPDKLTIKPLWVAIQKDLRLDPKDQSDQDIQRILGGLTSIVDGIGSFRTHAGSAHGGGRMRYRISKRHALLAVNAAHTLASFVVDTWDERRAPGKDTGTA